ncbi:MAG: RdgB/HAM1 family non-canonical purine NTP pyrophosphatase [Melioribacteraceae bacterium]|nr:RdgB/HAM1 family non-canonical purine NTP pyrophosphatase [Melioribacteraceae bacterium]
MKKLIFATGNKGKLKEVKKIFENTDYKIISLYDLGDVPEIIEDGNTYEANSLIKAKAIYNIHKLPVIADDSGLSVEQLNGVPGVYSARYAGENCTYDDNNQKLIKELAKFDEPHNAKFVCSAVFFDGENIKKAFGELHGEIISEFKGTHGFGYDPVFVPKDSDRTLAEFSSEEKNKISHRAIAFNTLKKLLEN